MAFAKTVRSLAEALEYAKELQDQLEVEVVGFEVAPLATLHGGRRSWHGIDPRDESKWLAETRSSTELEPQIPSPFEPAETFPELPPSRIGRWEVCFMTPAGADLGRLDYRVLIEKPRRVIRDEWAEDAPPAPSGDLNGSVVAMMQQQNKFTLDLLKTQHGMLATIGEEHKKLAENIREQYEQSQKMLQRVTVEREMALSANSGLSLQVAELRSESQLGMVVAKLAEKDPNALIDGAGRFVVGLIDVLRGKEAV
jgi:hypothetical protein